MHPDKYKLLHGPYSPPRLGRGERTVCLYRDTEVIITSWSDARIAWPRCRAIGSRGGGSGLLVTEELVRTIHSESSAALQHWFGVNEATVWKWRRAFGVTQWGTEGSRQLHQALSENGAARLRGKKLSKALVEPLAAVSRAPGSRPRGGRVAHWTSMLRLPWIVPAPASNTVMVCTSFLCRIRPLKVCTPLSAAVKVYVSGRSSTFAELSNCTVPQ